MKETNGLMFWTQSYVRRDYVAMIVASAKEMQATPATTKLRKTSICLWVLLAAFRTWT
jgi:hypothetical protein